MPPTESRDIVRIPAILLAAGLSTRMQAFKPLLPIGGQPLLHHVLCALLDSAAIHPFLIITGHNAAQIEASVAAFPFHLTRSTEPSVLQCVFNPQYATGEMLSSLLTGIAALPTDAPAFLLAFADQPAVAPATIRLLVERFHSQAPPPPLVLPVCQGKRGHPVIISSALISEIRALAADESLKTVVYRHLIDAALVSVDDPSILEDLDTPEEFARAQQRWTTPGK